MADPLGVERIAAAMDDRAGQLFDVSTSHAMLALHLVWREDAVSPDRQLEALKSKEGPDVRWVPRVPKHRPADPVNSGVERMLPVKLMAKVERVCGIEGVGCIGQHAAGPPYGKK